MAELSVRFVVVKRFGFEVYVDGSLADSSVDHDTEDAARDAARGALRDLIGTLADEADLEEE